MESMILELISPALVVICYCIGLIIKHLIDRIDNRYIPVIVAVFGAVLACLTQQTVSVDSVAQGIISGWASTGIHQTFKNLKGDTKWKTQE